MKLRSTVLSLLAALVLINSNFAHGALSAQNPGLLAGAALNFALAAMFAASGVDFSSNINFWVGLVFLDEKSNVFKFKAIEEQAGTAMGITANEREAFNAELAIINATIDHVANQMNAQKLTPEQGRQLMLSTLSSTVSAPAMTAYNKICAEMAKTR